MSEQVVVIVLVVLAGLVGSVEVFRSKGQSLLAWAVVALSVAGLVIVT